MRFLAVGAKAAQQLVVDHYLQTAEFDQGRRLGLFLAGNVDSVQLSSRVAAIPASDGVYLLSTADRETDLVVFDLDTAPMFHDREPRESVLILQRMLRFAVRWWGSQRLPISDRVIPGTSHAVVFPFPISSRSEFRLVIDTEPDKKRLSKRTSLGRFLLVYACGTSQRTGMADASLTVFRKAIDGLPEVSKAALATRDAVGVPQAADRITALRVTSLDHSLSAPIHSQLGYAAWLARLTEKQRAFVTAPLIQPQRIEGPAGTGKTLSLVLKSIHAVREAANSRTDHRSLFVAHSEATRQSIQDLFDVNDERLFARKDRYASLQSITVSTLHSLCAGLLRTEIAESEFLDRDAMESKNTQLLYVEAALGEVLDEEMDTHRPFLSAAFAKFLQAEDRWAVAQMMQHEIAVLIKGRAQESLETYQKVARPHYGLPLENESDRALVFLVFKRYQAMISEAGQFDTDDVVLSAIGQLNTPIWRRRRVTEGFDSILVDETHLFNLNELSVFHFLTRGEARLPIAYSVDKSQAVGDRGWTAALFEEAIGGKLGDTAVTPVHAVFRCSPEIVDLAFSVTSSGATLFANFEDPLQLANSSFTEEEERKCRRPVFLEFPNDEKMCEQVFPVAQTACAEMDESRGSVAIVVFDDALFARLRQVAESRHVPVEIVNKRGDYEAVKRAQRGKRFVLTTPDYVGGLEFESVVLVGVDGERVPPAPQAGTQERENFLTFASLGRLYVAITRARYQVILLGSATRGPSRLLANAIQSGALEVQKRL